MDQPHQERQQHMWWPQPQQQQQQDLAFVTASDSDHWDATMQLLASLYDSEILDLDGGKEHEPEDVRVVAASSQTQFSRWCIGGGGGRHHAPGAARSSDFTMNESLNEEDVAFIVNTAGAAAAGLPAPQVSPADGTAVYGASSGTSAAMDAESRKNAAGLRHTAALTSTSTASAIVNEPALAAKAPDTEVLSAAEEARRERNRLKVRRLYYRKLLCSFVPVMSQERLNALRAQVTSLEDSLERIKLAQNTRADLSVPIPDSTQPTTTSKRSVEYAELLEQLSSAKQRLQHENEYLRHVLSEHVRSMHAVSATLMELHVPPTAYLKIKSVTSRDCAELRRRTLKQMQNSAYSRPLLKDNGSICGWQSLHLIQDKVFQFIVEKSVPNVRCERFAQLTWSGLIDPNQYVRLYSPAVDTKCYVLQTVDDDNVVVFHEFRTMNPLEERPTVIRTIQLISRIHTDSGGSIISLTCLDRDKWVLDEPETHQEAIVWNDLSCWIQFQDIPNSSDCICVFGGFVPIFGANVHFWAVEIVQLAVRCEAMTIGSASFSLLSTTATTDDNGDSMASEEAD